MTQHHLKQGHFHVTAGWDRPLQHFFLNIFRTDLPEDEDDTVYVSLYDREAKMGGITLERLESKLKEHGINYDPALVEALKDDQRRNGGNEINHW